MNFISSITFIFFFDFFFFDKNFLIISLFYRGLIAFLIGIDHPLEMYCTLHQNEKKKKHEIR